MSIEYNRLTEQEKYKIENLETEITNYFLLNNFCPEYDFLQINLKLHLIIESINTLNTSSGTIDEIKSHLS